ncbi:uncharacterized protein [Asterias amurensis]|uniref:uncharacterized protein n=1 Tax=Asterias amurensis TaxID=7602 RepID=UPI003AB83925
MEWEGFTDAQLNRLKSNPDQHDQDSVTNYHQDGTRTDGRHYQQGRPQTSRPPSQRGRGPQGQNRPHVTDPINKKQMLSKPKQVQKQQGTNQKQEQMLSNQEKVQKESTNQKPDRTKAPGVDSSKTEVKKTVEVQSNPQTPVGVHRTKSVQSAEAGKKNEAGGDRKVQDEPKKKEKPLGKELGEEEGLSRELSKMEHFQQQQKEIEDENSRKKKLLAMAIADRKKKTQAETKRLAYIQKELSKIEEFLTNDVNILRDKIEEASRNYSEAQKRYQKAEAEFVTAKISLHKLSDHKEALTEHLCTIIRENELRKSKKLEELVEKLDVDNFETFEAEMEAGKAQAQARLSSSSSVGGTSEDAKGTPSTGEVSGEGGVPASPTIPPASKTEVHDPPSTPQGQGSLTSQGQGSLTSQGRGSITSGAGDDVQQQEVTVPQLNSNEMSETLGETDLNKNIDDSSSKSSATTGSGESITTGV